jgi:hypothetical protein
MNTCELQKHKPFKMRTCKKSLGGRGILLPCDISRGQGRRITGSEC